MHIAMQKNEKHIYIFKFYYNIQFLIFILFIITNYLLFTMHMNRVPLNKIKLKITIILFNNMYEEVKKK